MSTIRSLCTINREILGLLTLCSTMLIGCAGTEDPGSTDPKCQINTPSEKTPGDPYNLDTFKSSIVPLLVAQCTSGACHAQPTGQGNFTVWTDAASSPCNLAQTFNSTITKI